jgi:hypothetical protein
MYKWSSEWLVSPRDRSLSESSGLAVRHACRAVGNVSSVPRAEESCVKQPESRSFVSIGVEWTSRITVLGLEFALPTWGGYALDRWLGSSPWATLAGGMFGFTALMIHLFRINQEGTGS